MEVSLIADAVSVATSQGLGFLIRPNFMNSSAEQFSLSSAVLQVSSVIVPVDALAPPPVKADPYRTASRRLLRKKRRVRRRSATGGEDSEHGNEGGDGGFFGSDGPFFGGGGGGGFGGGGGRGWNFDRFGGHNWDESSSSSPTDPAFDFVYEVISWIVLSNCVHFAFKKVVRIAAGGMGDDADDREKVPMRLTSVC